LPLWLLFQLSNYEVIFLVLLLCIIVDFILPISICLFWLLFDASLSVGVSPSP